MKEYDYIVFGAGSAGGFLTCRLSAESSRRVLLLEAGGREGHWSIRMPVVTNGNINAPCMMIGERASDPLLEPD